MTRATLATEAQSQGPGAGTGGRLFPRGCKGTAAPLHSDPNGLWLFTADAGDSVIVRRSSLKLDGEKEPPRPVAPSPARRGWRPWDDFADAERPSLAASALRGLLL